MFRKLAAGGVLAAAMLLVAAGYASGDTATQTVSGDVNEAQSVALGSPTPSSWFAGANAASFLQEKTASFDLTISHNQQLSSAVLKVRAAAATFSDPSDPLNTTLPSSALAVKKTSAPESEYVSLKTTDQTLDSTLDLAPGTKTTNYTMRFEPPAEAKAKKGYQISVVYTYASVL